jgi:thymidylate kinase
MNKGLFIMIDGIAGSGKTTVIKAMYEWVESHYTCFRLEDWTKDRPPTFDDVKNTDVLFTLEPTRQWVGAAIRQEMSQTEHPYDGLELAHAFSLDRQLMYRRLILPALDAGKIIIQDRGVSTSLVYQPIMPNGISAQDVANLPGNKLALEHAPDHLILTSVPVEQIVERIRMRPSSQGAAGVFADVELARRVDAVYRAPWFRELFTSHGTQFHTLDTSGTLEQSKTNAVDLISKLLGIAETSSMTKNDVS